VELLGCGECRLCSRLHIGTETPTTLCIFICKMVAVRAVGHAGEAGLVGLIENAAMEAADNHVDGWTAG